MMLDTCLYAWLEYALQGIKLDMGIWSGLVNCFVFQPASVASPVQIELPDNERSDPDDHPSDNSDTPVEDKPKVDVSKLTRKNIYSIRFPLVTTYERNSADSAFLHMQNKARKSAQTSIVVENKKLATLQESRGISKQKWTKERKKNGKTS
ncbi:hypothetical protein Tco_0936381 [Tanacetum coccineum]